jgi:hypothetical protein
MRAPLDDPSMADFVARLDEINALADESPGFVWRLQSEGGEAPATYLRPFEDDRILFNLSVWKTVDEFKEYVYLTAHGEVMRKRREWFEKFKGMYLAMWWVKAGHIPTVAEAKQRLEYLEAHGETAHAFTFKRIFPPAETELREFIVQPLSPCLA